ncbi:hypothetical protein [Alicyclobacillus acidoterrestris]|uniref:Uncharacterized protein n=1 Tax=Alicyclobacillus acidoterrestris (strain ATCC 49025 / DSM 3922 / CIP 106132 / NCIMB 13137 / GD3B) TaxID=1356854 RepID=T0D848_ALIAG|nr:hypothetical protein [Alicyclobacillus acidoterrestris]EPZ47682.1 hypothetical protein N007_05355 [Alicyclobacillus acidoterrestris ATCC 49025]UNO47999.1 hypothetical protein K1I37_15095 [Alicyclobacillus acidoterrestris]
MTGKYTIVAFNSVGIMYEMKTNIISVTEEHDRVIVIHKPKGKRSGFKHTYDKDSELKIYKGWVDTGVNEQLMYESYQPVLQQIQGELVYTF